MSGLAVERKDGCRWRVNSPLSSKSRDTHVFRGFMCEKSDLSVLNTTKNIVDT